jgi:Na+/melibiose symporter-like transporter
LIAAAIIWNYPITEVRHKRIRARVERKLALSASTQPLVAD